jgi:pyruvate dehydrogenase E1 component alpha subunit
MGHSMSDPGKYRTRAEIEKHQERDPIKLFAANLVDEKVADAATLEKIDKEAREEVEDAVRFAEDSPFPAAEELYTDVYSNPIETGQSRIIR